MLCLLSCFAFSGHPGQWIVWRWAWPNTTPPGQGRGQSIQVCSLFRFFLRLGPFSSSSFLCFTPCFQSVLALSFAGDCGLRQGCKARGQERQTPSRRRNGPVEVQTISFLLFPFPVFLFLSSPTLALIVAPLCHALGCALGVMPRT